MKSKITLAALLFAFTSGIAQTSDRKFSIGLNAGLTDYHGELDHTWLNFDKAARANYGLSLMYNVNAYLNVGVSGNYGSWGYHLPSDQGVSAGLGYHLHSDQGVSADLLHANAQFRFKFDNGTMLKETSKFKPYVYLGTGLANYSSDNSVQLNPGTDWTGNAGIGATYMFTDLIGLNYNANYVLTNHDKRDGISVGANDQFAQHTLGLVFNLGKTVDTDGDRVSDKRDKCPSTPANVKVDAFGCAIDTDGDGIADYMDECPKVAGTTNTKGCPDADGDGIKDEDDACPNVAGVASANGCPDADGDGIKDEDDACPNVKGLATMKGCPDTDGDGVTDAEDACPKVKGLTTMKGCPDTDGDGIADKDDKCPTLAGVASNNGCPEIKQETKDVFEKALKGIQFQSGRDIIKTSSYSILNNVVDIMKENPTYKLKINGHTDSSGDDAKNLILSQKRADAVKAYLVKKGVDSSRLTTEGFGETKPKVSNDTREGMATNRRVEFEVKF